MTKGRILDPYLGIQRHAATNTYLYTTSNFQGIVRAKELPALAGAA
jgi:hypothetical protein